MEILTPSILAQLSSPDVSRLGVLYLVVLDPASHDQASPRVLIEHTIGDRARWDVAYADQAHRKARLSWRHRMSSRQLLSAPSHRLRSEEEQLWGGVWLDGLVVAASGAFPLWNERFSVMVATQLRAPSWRTAALGRPDCDSSPAQ